MACSQLSDRVFGSLVIVETHGKYTYTVPSFPAFTVRLRHVKYELIVDAEGGTDETVEIFDGFMRDCSALDSPCPFTVQLLRGRANAFFIEVSITRISDLLIESMIIINYFTFRRKSSLGPWTCQRTLYFLVGRCLLFGSGSGMAASIHIQLHNLDQLS